ncbi:hypothetical protein EI427_17255 [Flammeovirga pectinis]|uniref:Sulfatase N-terminal domain-containing protein n=2 Tax=Flammeovirga pectinis TaxID=2494373 RepID=A0A3S9P6T3_9BACT|nr:hypothetical protein EI427_17255 [Flammeovirga pectinis]
MNELNMKNLLILFSFISTLFFSSSLLAQSKKDSKPNVLFIMVDDMNDWVNAFGGHPQAITPNIDKVAKKGIMFKNAYCSAPLCNPSRTSLLTGLRPSTTGVYGNVEHFREEGFTDVVTLPQHFGANGYTTIAAGKIFHSPRGNKEIPKPGSDPGSFQTEKYSKLGTKFPDKSLRQSHGINFDQKGIKKNFKKSFDWYGIDDTTEETNDWQNAEYCADFLKENHDKPFFLACGIFRPHLPWYAPKKYFDMYDVETIQLPVVIENDLDDLGKGGNKLVSPTLHKELVEKGLWKEAVRAYLASLTFADECVGQVVDALDNSQYKDNTIIVIMGDHGWHLGEKEFWGKNTLWERSAKTPLIIFDPRTKGGKQVTNIVSLLDVYPTLSEMCGLPINKSNEGSSIYDLVKNPKKKTNKMVVTSKDKGFHTIRSSQYRYISYPDGTEELYDHNIDPNEWENVVKKENYKEALNLMRTALKEKISVNN